MQKIHHGESQTAQIAPKKKKNPNNLFSIFHWTGYSVLKHEVTGEQCFMARNRVQQIKWYNPEPQRQLFNKPAFQCLVTIFRLTLPTNTHNPITD